MLNFRTALDFAGQTATVTGAAGGIGGAMAVVLRERGLALVDRTPDVVGLAERLGGGSRAWALDINDEEAVAATVDEIAPAALFLPSAAAAMMGANLVADGGYTIR